MRRSRGAESGSDSSSLISGSENESEAVVPSKRAKVNDENVSSHNSTSQSVSMKTIRSRAAKTLNASSIGEDDMKEFPVGAILSLKLENFMTYDFTELHPGPGLNVVVGPNGSGKSSIVSAICLGLAGSPQSTGRASKEETYIKEGRDTAFIEIILSGGPEKQNYHIKRKISRKGSGEASSWALNNKTVTENRIKEVIKSLNIQVDNLCQFLAQERVCQFTGLNPQTLLRETEKAISDAALFDQHEQLISWGKNDKELEQKISTFNDQIQVLKGTVERLEDQVQRMNRREELREKLTILEKRKPWIQVDECEEQMAEFQKDYEESKAKYLERSEKLNPYVEIMEEIDQSKRTFETEDRKLKEKCTALKKNIETISQELDLLDEGVHRASQESKRKKEERADHMHKVEEAETRLNDSIQQLNQMKSNQPQLDMQELHKSKNENLLKIESLNQRSREAREIRSQKQQEFRRTMERFQAVSNVRRNRIELLGRSRNGGQELLEMLDFIENNKSRFRGEVLGPIGCELSVTDPRCASFVEKAIGNHLSSFIATDYQDYQILNDRFSGRVTVIIADKISDSIRPRQNLSDYDPQLGLGYVEDVVEGHEVVISVLRAYSGLDSQVYCLNDNDSLIQNVLKKHRNESYGFSSLLSPSQAYQVNFSSYSDTVSTRVEPISEAQVLRESIDSRVVFEIRQKLDDLKEEQGRLCDVESQTESEIAHAKREISQIQEQINESKNWRKQVEHGERLIRRLTDELNQLRLTQHPSDEEIDAQFHIAVQQNSALQVSSLRKYVGVMSQWSLLSQQKNLVTLNLAHLTERSKVFKSRREELEKSLAHFKNRCIDAEKRLNQHRKIFSSLRRKAEEVAPLEDYEAKFREEWVPSNMEDLNRLMLETDARMKGIVSDPGAMQRYEDSKKQMQTLQRNLAKVEEEKNKKGQSLEKLKLDWLSGLRSNIDKIDFSFSRLFQKMGCVASVRLAEHNDFGSYGLEILVQFRKEDSPKVLSKETHSGGERSVSTMLYLLALQSVTQVPFRVVDEINQGMDPKNERMIFERIVEQSGNGLIEDQPAPQYFLITPKLLPNLNYDAAPNISVLFVFNGWYMLDGKYSNLERYTHERMIK